MVKTRWILAAEADRIQDLVFRSAHLREVVGGSQLLTAFCEKAAPRLLEPYQAELVIADGGSFTVLFEDREDACAFGQQLAHAYRRITGSTLTVAEPVEWDGHEQSFATSNDRSRQQLAKAKRQGRRPAAGEQMPFSALCASCGVELASHYTRLGETDWINYLCQSCLDKAEWRKPGWSPFLRDFIAEVVTDKAHDYDCPGEAEDVARGWDRRGYVAYLLADGNGMGRVFGQCTTQKQLHDLSQALPQVLRQSLAEPTRQIMQHWATVEKEQEYVVPVLPLILGGDDLFALLPAPFALDFAQQVCLQFERGMAKALGQLEISAPTPTLAAAVVVCKAKHPHQVVHRLGEHLLDQAKRLSKVAALQGPAQSTVNWQVILGSRLAEADLNEKRPYRNSLRPYWAVDDATLPGWLGKSVQALVEQRLGLNILPKGRLEQLQTLYAPENLPTDDPDSGKTWAAELEQVIRRVARSAGQVERLRAALKALGSDSPDFWYNAVRPGPGGKSDAFYAHGLPDLLDAWDISLQLKLRLSDYVTQEV